MVSYLYYRCKIESIFADDSDQVIIHCIRADKSYFDIIVRDVVPPDDNIHLIGRTINDVHYDHESSVLTFTFMDNKAPAKIKCSSYHDTM